MATVYSNPFTAANGSAPSDLVLSEGAVTGGTRDVQSNELRFLTTATIFCNERGILPSVNWNGVDGEVRVKGRPATAQLGQYFLVMRSTGDWQAGDDTASTTGYRVLFNHTGGNILLFKDVATVNTQLGSTVSFAFATGVTYWHVLRCQGTTISCRTWDASGADPGVDNISVTDSSISSSGQFQMCFRNAAAAIADLRMDDLTIDNLASATGRRPILRRF